MKKFEEELSRKIETKYFAWETDLLQAIVTEKLSEEFMRKYADKLDWRFISNCQNLSESFLREFRDEIIWEAIDNTNSFSLDFIREFGKELDLNHRRLRNEIKGEFK